MSTNESDEKTIAGFECHDCGEVYRPDADLSPCLNEGHYVGPIAGCVLPQLERYLTGEHA